MSWSEFLDWLAYYELEPFGPERADWNAAMVATVMANAHRDAKKQKRPFAVKDFMFRVEDKTQPGDWQTMKAKFQQAAALANRKKG